MSPGNCTKALSSTVANLLFPAVVSIRTHQQLLAPLKGLRLHLINIRGRQRLVTPPEGGSFRQLILAKQQTTSLKLIPENHRHLLTPLDEWSLQATDTNQKPKHHAMINFRHAPSALLTPLGMSGHFRNNLH